MPLHAGFLLSDKKVITLLTGSLVTLFILFLGTLTVLLVCLRQYAVSSGRRKPTASQILNKIQHCYYLSFLVNILFISFKEMFMEVQETLFADSAKPSNDKLCDDNANIGCDRLPQFNSLQGDSDQK